MNARFSLRVVVFVTAECLLLGFRLAPLPAETPPSGPLTAQQRERLNELNRLLAEGVKLWKAGKQSEAIAAAEKILAISREVFGPAHAKVADALYFLARLQEEHGDFAVARKAYKEALDLKTKLYGGEHWRVIDARLHLADMEFRAKLTPGQQQRLREVTAEFNRASALSKQGEYQKALLLVHHALEQWTLILGEKHRFCALGLAKLAELHAAMGDYAKAEPMYRQALDITKQALGEKHPDYATGLNNLGELYERMGAYAKAELLHKQARDIRSEALGERHLDFASSLNNLAMLYRAIGEYAKAEPLLKQALEILGQTSGQTHPRYALTLNNLASLYVATGDYAKAETLLKQALDLLKHSSGEKHPDYATCLNNLAVLYWWIGEYAKAEPLLKQTLEIRGQVLGEKHPEYAVTLNNLAEVYIEMGEYTKAGRPHKQAQDILRWKLGEQHPLYALNLSSLAKLYQAMGESAQAEAVLKQASDILKHSLGEKHPDYAATQIKLAELYLTIGEYAKAEPLLEKALDVLKHLEGEDHPRYALSLVSLAQLHWSMGDYAKAEPLYKRALDIVRRKLGEQHPRYALTLNNLASHYVATGDYAKAETLLKQALDILKHSPGEKHPEYATGLSNLAQLYWSIGEYAKVEPLLKQARDIKKQTLGEKHPDYALSLNILADLYVAIGEHAKAERLLKQARDILERGIPANRASYASMLSSLAELYWSLGDCSKAEPLCQEALHVRRQTLGERHPDYAKSLTNLAMLHLAKNEAKRSLRLTHEALPIIRVHLDLLASIQSERQQLQMNKITQPTLGIFLSAAVAAKASGEEVYPEVLIWKGAISLRQQQMRRLRCEMATSDPKTAYLYADLETSTRRLATLINLPPKAVQLEGYRRRLDKANAEVERLQQTLAAVSTTFRKDRVRRRRTPAELRQALPPGVALVDMVEYNAFTPQAKGIGTWERRLAAFVVRKDRPIEWVDLGPVETLKEAIEPWLKSLESHNSLVQRTRPVFGDGDPAVTLRERLWEPLEPHLKDAATVLISPDGEVARLPWGALPGSTPDKYLLEERAIALIAIPQFLPELLQGDKEADTRPPALLLVGDVDYGAAPGKSDVEIASRGLSSVLQRGGGASWKHLDASKQEAATIRDVFERRFPKGTAKLLDEGRATEGAVRAEAPQYAWLHLATHGYFAPQKVNSALGRGKKRAEPNLSMAEQRGFVGFPQGLLAGVVLAGANKGGGEGEDDGILTAMEVAELDLRGCQLAVLSACETGLGEKSGGEGVLGLQRAFQVAGARGVVASLWSVPDEATRALMERFYDNLWQKKMGRLEALRDAQLWLLTKDAKDKRRTPPLFWAAFVLSGDWR